MTLPQFHSRDLSPGDLMQLSHSLSHADRAECASLIGNRARYTVIVRKDLANYAANVGTAAWCAMRLDYTAAETYCKIAETIRASLPHDIRAELADQLGFARTETSRMGNNR